MIFFKSSYFVQISNHFASLAETEHRKYEGTPRKTYLSRQRSESSINNKLIGNGRQQKYQKNSQTPLSSKYHEENNNIHTFVEPTTQRMPTKSSKSKKVSRQKSTRDDVADASIIKKTPDIELLNLKIHDSDNDLEILSHQKTKKLISTDLNSIISGSSTPVRGQPAKYIRPTKRYDRKSLHTRLFA